MLLLEILNLISWLEFKIVLPSPDCDKAKPEDVSWLRCENEAESVVPDVYPIADLPINELVLLL